ncbi:MAG: cytochrome c [Deltaproteobacteria bacterium]|nr:cytochrome c [Deltaproteobacteria bacterium]
MPRIVKFSLIIIAVYCLLKIPGVFFTRPIPASVLSVYLLFAVVATLLAMTATGEGATGFIEPIASLFADPSKRAARNIVLVIVPIAAAWIAYAALRPDDAPPPIVRSIHPAPPAAFTAYGRTIELASLTNPYRASEKENPSQFRAAVDEGAEIYFKNCFYCHGAKLDGAGHYARGLSPSPVPFRGTDTIAQLQESYVFWRVAKGGPGLPREGGPWLSAMPAWEDALTEDEAWKVVTFIYDYTGNRPRSWAK